MSDIELWSQIVTRQVWYRNKIGLPNSFSVVAQLRLALADACVKLLPPVDTGFSSLVPCRNSVLLVQQHQAIRVMSLSILEYLSGVDETVAADDVINSLNFYWTDVKPSEHLDRVLCGILREESGWLTKYAALLLRTVQFQSVQKIDEMHAQLISHLSA
jgi:hypothetical protein